MTENSLKFLLRVSEADLKTFLQSIGQPAYRSTQILDWIWKKHTCNPFQMKNIGSALQKALSEAFICEPVRCVEQIESTDAETTKWVFALHDGACIESVLIRSFDRATVCVSSQVGCPIGCTFCASGKKGCVRNLDAAEIIAQVLWIQKYFSSQGHITNIVFMGMGEPLWNYEEVVSSICLLTDPEKAAFSRRRITVSTVGIVENIYRLADADLGVNIAVSLHAPTQELRQKIIPFARKYALMDLMKAVEYYQKKTGRDCTYEYILIHHVNDREKDALDLAHLLAGRKGSVNLIPYNAISGVRYEKPPSHSVQHFCQILDEAHIAHTCRYTKGDDISAACGQLALRL